MRVTLKKQIIIIAVLLMLCLLTGTWLLLFDRNTEEESTDKEAEISNIITSGMDQIKSKSSSQIYNQLENWLLADHVYPHGHTDMLDEYTFAAYDAALSAGAHYVDTDVVISGDGTLYVSHDLNAFRITGDSRNFASMNDDEIGKLRGRSGDKLLKLGEVLDKYGKDVKYLIELKSSDSKLINAFKAEMDERGLSDAVILQSEFPNVLEKIEDIYPEMPKLLVVKNDAALDLAMDEDYVDIVGARVQYMTQNNCDAAHNAGKKFVGWPIDTENEIVNAIRIGADAYFTNDTELALNLEKQYRKIKLGEKDTILFASDYQSESGFAYPKDTLGAVTAAAIADDEKPDTAVLCGDYTNDSKLYNYQLSAESSIEEIRNALNDEAPYLSNEDMLFVQGNHDKHTESIAESGLHEYKNYLIYVLNTENDFPWKQGTTPGSYQKVQSSSNEMKKCFEELVERGETRPVFIAGHVPLHYTARTSSMHTTGDNLYASLIFEVVNEAAKSLDIIYMYGHNHSKGWDCYMGGAAVFKSKGDSLLLPVFEENDNSTDRFEEKTMNFTYLNAGYVGYYMNCAPGEDIAGHRAADEALTCTVCDVYPDRIEIRRYDKEGSHVLGAAGEGNPYRGGIDSNLIGSRYYSKETKGPGIIMRKAVAGKDDADSIEQDEAA